MLEALCFHAQQAAEKAIKAVLVVRGITPPRTHNIGTLLDLIPTDIAQPDNLREAAALTDFAVMSRYPGVAEPIGDAEYREALQLAEAVGSWTEQMIAGTERAP
jgi:HEPN domain-containing protein